MGAYYDDGMVTLHHGDAAAVAGGLERGSVRTIVTSPPYFGLRDYDVEEQIGAEESLQEYVERLVAVFESLRGVLADDGTLWLNLGDSYGADKNLLMVPARVALAMQDAGWILRSEIVWAKPNPMPESVTDRPTKAHEQVFLFAKSSRYYFDAESIAEQAVTSNPTDPSYRANGKSTSRRKEIAVPPGAGAQSLGDVGYERSYRNKRDVWTVPMQPFPGAHFATYPPELIRPCILAGSARGDVVLDPFSGSGTTGLVATQEGRRYVGIDLSREYLDMSLRTRFAQPVLDLTGGA